MKRNLAALASGLLFGLGLALAQMTDPLKVQGFLDVAGAWDASLALVLGGAAGFSLLAFRLVTRRGKPVFDMHFHLPKATRIDAPLLIGSAIFGVGWGLAGYCPGPALAALSNLSADAVAFVVAMLAGNLLYRGLKRPEPV